MNIIIFGAGGQAKETIDLIEANSEGKILGYVNRVNIGDIFGYPFLGVDDDIDKIIKSHKATHFFIAIGDLSVRSRLYETIKQKLIPLTIISKNATVSKHSKRGDHVIIYPGVVINADVEIGNDVYINTNASISHEVKIGDHVNINPGANVAGKVVVEDFCTIGIGASIKQNVTLAKTSTIGAGAVVVKDTQANNTYIGVPAEILK